MAITAAEIITNRVRILLRDIDTGGIQWKDPELIAWLNEACSDIARYRPESSSQTVDIPLVAGAQQTIPSGDSMLLEVICNQDPSNANTVGRVVRRAERSTLDNEDPTWMYSAPSDVVYRYVTSLTDPRTFYVYPPSNGAATAGLKIVSGKPPAEVTTLNDNLPLPDHYAPIVANYIMFRALAKLTESESAQQRSAQYLALYNGQVGATDKAMEGRNSIARQPTQPERA